MEHPPALLIFDVNETLLDLAPLRHAVNTLLEEDGAFSSWFDQLLQYAWAETLSGRYRKLGEIGRDVLHMAAQRKGLSPGSTALENCLSRVRELPAHEEVGAALQRLKEDGHRMVALSNSDQATLEAQLQFAGISKFFDAVYSVEQSRKYKPHPSPYRFVVQSEGAVDRACMIAAHPWDLMGARAAGLETAFIEREGKVLFPGDEAPDYQFEDLSAMANRWVRA